MSLSVEFLAGLYNKHSCYADRLTEEQLAGIHIPTGVETVVRKWLLAKKDVVLLGNPGDGKTHLIRQVDDAVKRVKAEVVLDATAEKDYGRLINKWKKASDASRPFCVAINQGPLNQLLSVKSGTNRPTMHRHIRPRPFEPTVIRQIRYPAAITGSIATTPLAGGF